MNETIERAAKAAYLEHYAASTKSPLVTDSRWDVLDEYRKRQWRSVVREAFRSARAPTAAMSAVGKLTLKGAADCTEREQAEYVWSNMVDAILEDGE